MNNKEYKQKACTWIETLNTENQNTRPQYHKTNFDKKLKVQLIKKIMA